MAGGQASLAHALAMRLRQIAKVLDRLDRLEAGTGKWLESQSEQDREEASLAMVLRAFHTATDTVNFNILKNLVEHATIPMGQLQTMLSLDRFTLNEHLNDLIQVAMITREIDTDHAQITDAGSALTTLILDLQRQTAEKLGEVLKPTTTLE